MAPFALINIPPLPCRALASHYIAKENSGIGLQCNHARACPDIDGLAGDAVAQQQMGAVSLQNDVGAAPQRRVRSLDDQRSG